MTLFEIQKTSYRKIWKIKILPTIHVILLLFLCHSRIFHLEPMESIYDTQFTGRQPVGYNSVQQQLSRRRCCCCCCLTFNRSSNYAWVVEELLAYGNRLHSMHCREFHYLKLCRPAYFVRTTRLYIIYIYILIYYDQSVGLVFTNQWIWPISRLKKIVNDDLRRVH